MIDYWALEGFKAFKLKSEFNFKENVLLCGANSSGKSSLIQSLLLMAQTNSSRLADESVVVNGHFTQLGSFNDLKNDLSEKSEINIGFGISIGSCGSAMRSRPIYSDLYSLYTDIRVDLTFGVYGDSDDPENDIFPALIKCKLSLKPKKGEDQWIEVVKRDDAHADFMSVAAKDLSKFKEFKGYSVSFDEHSSSLFRKNFGENLSFFGAKVSRALPADVVLSFDARQANSRAVAKIMAADMDHIDPKMYGVSIPSNVFEFLDKRMRATRSYELLNQNERKSVESLILEKIRQRDEAVQAIKWVVDVSRLTEKAFKTVTKVAKDHAEGIERIFVESQNKRIVLEKISHPLISAAKFCNEYLGGNVKYLGPLRDEPRALYPLSPLVDPIDVGLRGENTAAVYSRNKNKIIDYISPQSILIGDQAIERAEMGEAAIKWLKYIGVTEEITAEQKGKLGYEVKVRPSNSTKSHDLTHVGVGISQILPIVVMSLLAKPGDIIVFEQPELHLHPKMQARLADFFVSLSMYGVQVIIETHSEYLVDRYRLRIAKSESQDFDKKIIIYFLSMCGGDVDSQEVVINKFGRISNWPIDFFDQSSEESQQIIAAAAKKKRMMESKND